MADVSDEFIVDALGFVLELGCGLVTTVWLVVGMVERIGAVGVGGTVGTR